ncbi:MAG: uridine kinase [Flavobacteriaceae bacterium]|nr:uridine kinase [Flavobacteriaceae bacterium]|tara:strand:+ start:9181 stop:9795 length:615 start_codon:yes stop_codon:yes gene_type:complete
MILIGICGGTASGKTTLSNKISQYLKNFNYSANEISLDNYYKDLSNISFEERCNVNFDSPKSIDIELFYQHLCALKKGKDVKIPIYSYKLHNRTKQTKLVTNSSFIITEGLFIFLEKRLRKCFDLKIYLDINYKIRHSRRLHRDIIERGRDRNEVENRFKSMIDVMHNKYVDKTKEYADVILKSNDNFEIIEQVLNSFLNEFKK